MITWEDFLEIRRATPNVCALVSFDKLELMIEQVRIDYCPPGGNCPKANAASPKFPCLTCWLNYVISNPEVINEK